MGLNLNKLKNGSLNPSCSGPLARAPHHGIFGRTCYECREACSRDGHFKPVIMAGLPMVIFNLQDRDSEVCKHATTTLSQPYLYFDLCIFFATRSMSRLHLWYCTCHCRARTQHVGTGLCFACSRACGFKKIQERYKYPLCHLINRSPCYRRFNLSLGLPPLPCHVYLLIGFQDHCSWCHSSICMWHWIVQKEQIRFLQLKFSSDPYFQGYVNYLGEEKSSLSCHSSALRSSCE